MRRSQDSINPRTHPYFMTPSHEDTTDETEPHPYWYGRILGVFDADIIHTDPYSRTSTTQRMEFVWVRWLGRDLTYKAGWEARRLHRVGFIPDTEEGGAFGFLNPSDIIRAVHLIPAFAHGKTSQLLGPSMARQPHENNEDWIGFYVNM